MTNTIRAALERLLDDLDEGRILDGAVANADAALAAEPVGEGPTDQELTQFLFDNFRGPIEFICDAEEDAHVIIQNHIKFACAVLARWGHPAAPPALPHDYIDPEHQGCDLKLLETFYQACNAEGGTADEIHLRGIRAVLAAHPAAPPAPVGQRDAVIAAVAEALGDAYDCLRVWEAWSVGTMGQDDFALVAEDSDRVAEIADAAIEAMRPAAPPVPEVGEQPVSQPYKLPEPGDVRELVSRLKAKARLEEKLGAPSTAALLAEAAALLQQPPGDRSAIAAALRAAADQVDAVNVPDHIRGDAYWPYRNGRAAAQEHLVAIAAELEGLNA